MILQRGHQACRRPLPKRLEQFPRRHHPQASALYERGLAQQPPVSGAEVVDFRQHGGGHDGSVGAQAGSATNGPMLLIGGFRNNLKGRVSVMNCSGRASDGAPYGASSGPAPPTRLWKRPPALRPPLPPGGCVCGFPPGVRRPEKRTLVSRKTRGLLLACI